MCVLLFCEELSAIYNLYDLGSLVSRPYVECRISTGRHEVRMHDRRPTRHL